MTPETSPSSDLLTRIDRAAVPVRAPELTVTWALLYIDIAPSVSPESLVVVSLGAYIRLAFHLTRSPTALQRIPVAPSISPSPAAMSQTLVCSFTRLTQRSC